MTRMMQRLPSTLPLVPLPGSGDHDVADAHRLDDAGTGKGLTGAPVAGRRAAKAGPAITRPTVDGARRRPSPSTDPRAPHRDPQRRGPGDSGVDTLYGWTEGDRTRVRWGRGSACRSR